MKVKSVLGAMVAVGVMALMAVGVQAATYSAGEGTAESGVASVPVVVTPDEGETDLQVSGYVVKFTYDKTKATPVLLDTKDATGGNLYATADSGFDGTDSVLVADIVESESSGNSQTLAVAWASAKPVDVSAAAEMATVKFDVADGVTEDIPIEVTVVAVTNDGLTNADNPTGANGKITVSGGTVFLRGDANGDGVVDAKDATLIEQSLVHLDVILEENKLKADANADGIIDAKDATLIAQSLVKLDVIPE